MRPATAGYRQLLLATAVRLLKAHTGDTTRVIPAIPNEEHVELTDTQLAALKDVPHGTGVLLVVRGPNEGTTFVLDADVDHAPGGTRSPTSSSTTSRCRGTTRSSPNRGGPHLDRRPEQPQRHLRQPHADRRRGARCADGDEVQIGKFRMVYLVDASGQD